MPPKDLLDAVVCPWCMKEHAVANALAYDAARQTLTCAGCRRVYPIRDDIPILLIDEAKIEE